MLRILDLDFLVEQTFRSFSIDHDIEEDSLDLRILPAEDAILLRLHGNSDLPQGNGKAP